MSVVSVVCCQVEVSATSWPLTRPEASYRLWCVPVCYRNLVDEEPNLNQ
jgi:hypothetical protein